MAERETDFTKLPEGVEVQEGAKSFVRSTGGITFLDAKGHWMKRIAPKLPVARPPAPPSRPSHTNNHAFTADDRSKSHLSRSRGIKPELENTIDFPLLAIVDELAEKYNLTKNMVNFLAVRLNFSTDTDAARAVGLAARTPHGWRFSNDRRYGREVGFNKAYEELMSRAKEASQKKINSLAWKTVSRIEEQLDATRKVRRTVQTDDGPVEEIEEEPDYNARFQGIQGASRWLGEWGTEPRVVQNTQYVTVMDQFGKLMSRITEEKIVEGEFEEKDG